MAVGSVYKKSCINCGEENIDYRNEMGIPCEKCIPNCKKMSLDEMIKILRFNNRLLNLKKINDFYKEYRNFENFFKKIVGYDPTGFQRHWAKRVFLKKSFTMVAPTGVGKSTFGIVMSLYLAFKDKKSILIFPTLSLVIQTKDRFLSMLKSLSNDGIKLLHYHSKMSKKEKEEFWNKFEEENFHILVVSSQFVSNNRSKIKDKIFDFVFVDDVDAVLKSSKNIDTLIMMTGVKEEDIDEAYKNLIRKQFFNKEVDKKGILVVSSATAKPKGIKPKLFRLLLDFEVGSLVVSMRNITNVLVRNKDMNTLLNMLKELKDGILLFIPKESEAREIFEFLKDKDLKIGNTWENFEKSFEEFKKGNLNVLIGISKYYGKLVRGIDFPERIKFAIFWGTPVFEYDYDIEKVPLFIIKKVLQNAKLNCEKVRKLLSISKTDPSVVRNELKKCIDNENWKNLVKNIFDRFFVNEEKIFIPDVLTYIQASGRTSRMYKFSLTKGVSILFENNEKVFENLRERLEWLTEENWLDWDQVNWEELLKEVEDSRRKMENSKIFENKSFLFIVESPTKAETLSKYLGRSSIRKFKGISVYESVSSKGIVLLTATRGHLYDLVTNEGFHGVKVENDEFYPLYGSIKYCRNCGYQFTDELNKCPKCGSEDIEDKRDILESLRELALEVDEIMISSDPDTEGEKISWDVTQYLLPVNDKVKRVEMHEITKYGLKEAFEKTRKVNEDLVKAQMVRRIQDRWTGFELSKRVQKVFGNKNLSAGRVQSTVLGWIVEREREYNKSLKDYTSFLLNNDLFIEVEGRFNVKEVFVEVVDESVEEKLPLPPYNTAELLKELSKKLKLSVKEIMNILQELFEKGFITYHRTDSTRVSLMGQEIAKRYLENLKLKDLFEGKSWGKEGAHECIRPVKPLDLKSILDMINEGIIEPMSKNHLKIYDFIFKRFIASQMKAAKIEKQRIMIKIGEDSIIEKEIYTNILNEGWTKLVDFKLNKPFTNGNYEVINLKNYKKHSIQLYTQGDIISEMKEKNIGRPSTYSKIIEILFQRGYVIQDKYNRIRATKLGMKVYDYLKGKYFNYVDEKTTRKLEEIMIEVENGNENYKNVIKELYIEIKSLE